MPDASAPDSQPKGQSPLPRRSPIALFSPGRLIKGWLNFMHSRESTVTGHPEPLVVGKIYRLRFPGIAARVIKSPPGGGSRDYPYLVESLVLRSRWYVNARGEPDNINSPLMLIPVQPPGGGGEKEKGPTIVWDQ